MYLQHEPNLFTIRHFQILKAMLLWGGVSCLIAIVFIPSVEAHRSVKELCGLMKNKQSLHIEINTFLAGHVLSHGFDP